MSSQAASEPPTYPLPVDMDLESLVLSTAQKLEKNVVASSLSATLAVNPTTKLLHRRERVIEGTRRLYRHEVKRPGSVLSQLRSGRCWIFAGLDILRHQLILKYDLPETFSLSTSYVFFWEKLERCNYFLWKVVETAHSSLESRLMHHLLQDPLQDGGQWTMLCEVLDRHGVVPEDVFPEVDIATSSVHLNKRLTLLLRSEALVLRTMTRNSVSREEIALEIKSVMNAVTNIMCMMFGIPGTLLAKDGFTFTWEYKGNKDGAVRSIQGLTPQHFYHELTSLTLDKYVPIIHDPRNPFYSRYTVQHLGSVAGAAPVTYLNLNIEEMEELVKSEVRSGRPVWFGCDVARRGGNKDLGILDTQLYDDSAMGFPPSLTLNKASRLRMGDSLMTHAMVFTGYHDELAPSTQSSYLLTTTDTPHTHESVYLPLARSVEEGGEAKEDAVSDDSKSEEGEDTPSGSGSSPSSPPATWFKVKNSWGPIGEGRGYFSMSRDWFHEYVFQIAVPMSSLSPFQRRAWKTGKVEVLPPWDPMGALAD